MTSLMANTRKYVIVVRHPRPSSRCNLEKKPKTPRIRRRWNDLPEDLVGEIMVRLSCPDRIRFAACSKKLWSLIPRSGETDQFPWLVNWCCKKQSSFCYSFNLFDPIHQTPYSVTLVREATGHKGFGRDGVSLLCSRNSWLLLLVGARNSWIHAPTNKLFTSLFLVSPFTKQVMALPDLDHSPFVVGDQHGWSGFQAAVVASYSSNPSSPHCVYFVLHQTDNSQHVRISTFRNGDTVWKTGQFDRLLDSFASVVYHGGRFYCVSYSGCIAAYSVVQNEWKSVPKPTKRRRRGCSRHSYLLVCEGKLVWVFLDEVIFEENYKEGDQCTLFEYVQQPKKKKKEVWVKKTSCGNNALFLYGFGSFSVSTSSVMANRIYYRGSIGGDKKYFSLDDGKAYECESSCWPGIDSWGTWIEPPKLHSHAALHFE